MRYNIFATVQLCTSYVRLLLNWFLPQVKKLKKGGRAVTYSPDGSSVAVGQNDGGFLILDSESLEKIVGFKDRKESISDIKFSPGNSCLGADCLGNNNK